MDLEQKIIFENDDVLVIDKPAGLAVHGVGSDAAGTLVEWFLARVPRAKDVGDPRVSTDGEVVERSGIVHRLDRETSGVMILAKTQAAFDHLKEQFKDRLVRKEYRALVYGKTTERWGTISRPIGRSAKDWRLRSSERGAKGVLRDATTDWERISTGEYQGEAFSYLKLLPKTGRMHQLRVHLKSISRPIVGDRLYAGPKAESSNNLGLNRLALHAHRLKIFLPTGEEREFEALLPPEIAAAAAMIAETV